jgi:hypothetical protein
VPTNLPIHTSLHELAASDLSQPTTVERRTYNMSSNSLNYPAYYIVSLVPHIYAGSILSANGYQVNNANPKASLSPDAVKGKVPDAVYVCLLTFMRTV